jgi:PPP family 3-phenylpropionic acid transporter
VSVEDRAAGGIALRFSLAYFLLYAVYGVSSPYLQLLVRGLGYGPAAVGLLLGIFEVVGIAGPLVFARAADKRGSVRPALLGAVLLVLASLAPLSLLPRPLATALGISLFAIGLKTLIPLLDASAVSFGEPGKNRPDYGKLRSVGSAGFVAMALFLQAIPGFDKSPPWKIALFIGLAAGAFALALLILPRAKSGPGARAAGSLAPAAGRRRIDPVFALGLGVIALSRLAMAPINSFLSLYAVEELKWHAVGGLWAMAAFVEIPFMILSGRIIARVGPMKVIALSAAAIALRLGICAAFPSPAGLVAGQLLHSLCYGLFQPAAVAFVSLRVPPERRAAGMVVFMGLGFGLPTFLGSALGGVVVEAWGYRLLFASYIVFALFALGLWAAARQVFGEKSPRS